MTTESPRWVPPAAHRRERLAAWPDPILIRRIVTHLGQCTKLPPLTPKAPPLPRPKPRPPTQVPACTSYPLGRAS